MSDGISISLRSFRYDASSSAVTAADVEDLCLAFFFSFVHRRGWRRNYSIGSHRITKPCKDHFGWNTFLVAVRFAECHLALTFIQPQFNRVIMIFQASISSFLWLCLLYFSLIFDLTRSSPLINQSCVDRDFLRIKIFVVLLWIPPCISYLSPYLGYFTSFNTNIISERPAAAVIFQLSW